MAIFIFLIPEFCFMLMGYLYPMIVCDKYALTNLVASD